MRRIKIVADDKIPFLKGVLEPYANVEYYPGSAIDHSKVKKADALIIRTRTLCTSELLDSTIVRVIATATIGHDHIDTDYCLRHNIKWVNAPGCNSASVMQYVASALFTASEEMQFDLSEKTIGIIGVGNVGSKVEKFCRTIGIKVLLNDPPRERKEGTSEFVSLRELLESSDIITFHVPLSKTGIDKTYHLADEKFFTGVRPGAIMINTSRGPVVKSSALKEAIKNKIISYSVLDVWENEPNIDQDLLYMINIATPHIAGYSADGKANGTAVCVNALNDYFDLGMPENWYPSDIPLPGNSIVYDQICNGKNSQSIFSDIILHTYNIKKDDFLLKSIPENFEQHRDHYPVRREYPVYTARLSDCDSSVIKKLVDLGFKTEIK